MLTEELKQEILHYILHPVDQPPGMREQVQAFLYERLGVESYKHGWEVEWGFAYRWNFCFDADGRLVPFPERDAPYEAARGYTMICVRVSRRGPYVTASSYASAPREPPIAGIRIDWDEDRPVSAKAVDLAQQVAQRFGLTYLDAAELLAWELDDSVANDPFVDVWEEGWDGPNGYNMLF